MKKFSIIIAILTFSLLSGCVGINNFAFNAPSMSMDSRELKLENQEYKIIKKITGEATATYILGIGGMSEKAHKLFHESYQNMVHKANLGSNQTIIDVVAEKNFRCYLGIISLNTVYTTGTVIEFTKNPNIQKIDPTKQQKSSNTQKTDPTEQQISPSSIMWNGVECFVVSTKSDGSLDMLVSKEEVFVQWADNFFNLDNSLKINNTKDGNSNYSIVKQQKRWREKYPAFAWCASLGEGWYFPSKEEMEQVVKSGVLGSIDAPYLTSTEADVNNCYAVGAKGIQHFDKFKRANVRAIFRFK